MQYKTIILELIQQRPEMHEQLRMERKLKTTLEMYAKELKENHQTIRDQLQQENPESNPSLISSQAFEMACKEMEDRMPPVSGADKDQELTLDAAIAHVRSPLSRG